MSKQTKKQIKKPVKKNRPFVITPKPKQIIKGLKRQMAQSGVATSNRERVLVAAAIEEQQRIAALQQTSWREAALKELVESTKQFVNEHGTGRVVVSAHKYPDRETVRATLQDALSPSVRLANARLSAKLGAPSVVGVSEETKHGTLVIHINPLEFTSLIVRGNGIGRGLDGDGRRVQKYSTAESAMMGSMAVGAEFKLGVRRFRILGENRLLKEVSVHGMPGVAFPITEPQFVAYFETFDSPVGAKYFDSIKYVRFAKGYSATELVMQILTAYQTNPSFTSL